MSQEKIKTTGVLWRILLVWATHIIGYILFTHFFMDSIYSNLKGDAGVVVVLFYPFRDIIAVPLAFFYFILKKVNSSKIAAAVITAIPFLPTLLLGLPVSLMDFLLNSKTDTLTVEACHALPYLLITASVFFSLKKSP